MSLPGIPGIIVLPLDLPPRRPSPSSCWSSDFIHLDGCRCERCSSFAVNGHAPKEKTVSDLPTLKSTGFPHLDGAIERALEKAFKAGFDAGIEHQKKAAPPPKARELAKQLDAAREAAAEAFDAALTAFAQVQEQLVAVTRERDEASRETHSLGSRVEELVDALTSAYRHHCVVECVSEDDGCTCSDFDAVRAVLADKTPLEAAVIRVSDEELHNRMRNINLVTVMQVTVEQERKHCRCGRPRASMNDYMGAPQDLREDKRGLCWTEFTGEACR